MLLALLDSVSHHSSQQAHVLMNIVESTIKTLFALVEIHFFIVFQNNTVVSWLIEGHFYRGKIVRFFDAKFLTLLCLLPAHNQGG